MLNSPGYKDADGMACASRSWLSGRVLTHHQILTKVWGEQYTGDAHMLRVNVSNLRRKLEPDPLNPRYLITEPGVGYRFRSD